MLSHSPFPVDVHRVSGDGVDVLHHPPEGVVWEMEPEATGMTPHRPPTH